jgi:hypothetical protein
MSNTEVVGSSGPQHRSHRLCSERPATLVEKATRCQFVCNATQRQLTLRLGGAFCGVNIAIKADQKSE